MSIHVTYLPGSASRLAGGLFYSVRRLSESINEFTNCKTSVIAHADQNTEEDLGVWKETPQILKSQWFLSRCRELTFELNQQKPDIIHPQFLWSYASISSLRHQVHNPKCIRVVSPRGMLDSWAVKNSAFKKTVARILFENNNLNSAACIHALCENEAIAVRNFGQKNAIATIPNGVDIPNLPAEICTHRLSEKRKTLLFLGRIHPKKGISELIDAWHLVSNRLRNWHLEIAGWDDGGHLNLLKQKVSDLGLMNSVEFIGPLVGAKKTKKLFQSNAFILPSFSEGLPIAVLEAWAHQLPVLKTKFCNLADGFHHNAAVEVSPNANSIAEGLETLSSFKPEELNEMGKNGRRLVQRKYSWKTIAEKMASLYHWLQGHSPRPDFVMNH